MSKRALFSCLISFLITPWTYSGTVAYYRFEDGSAGASVTSIVDSGPSHISGIVDSAQPLHYSADVPPFASGGRLSLDASGDGNFARIPHNDALAIQGSWTVEAFIKPHDPQDSFGGSIGDPEHYSIVTKQNNSGFGSYLAAWSIAYEPNGKVLGFIGFGNNAGVLLESTNTIRDGKWHHIALVLARDVRGKADRLSLFVDSVFQGQIFQEMPDLFYGAEPLYIGAGNFGNDPNGTGDYRRNFDGLIDEVRISDAALDPSQFLTAATIPITPVTLSIEKAGAGNVRITWTSQASKNYQLQWSPSLGSAWSALGGAIVGNGNVLAVVDGLQTASGRLYRMFISE